ncbi:MAG: PAS domain S-box protein [Anaerolineales bacterium]
MAEHEPQPSKSSLRQQALERLANAPQTLRDLSRTEILQLAHELQVHQIELELQNEQLKSTLAELERARSLFFSLFNRSPIGYAVLDEQGIIQEVNQTFCEMVTYRMDEVVGKPLQNFLHKDDRSAFLARYRATFRQPQNKVFELRLNGAEQQVLWVRVQGERLLLPAEQAGKDDHERLLLAFSDITAQKIAEENRRLDERRLQSLVEIAQYPYSSVEELLRFTLEKALLVTQSEIGYLLDYNEETQQLRIRFVSEGAQELSKLDPAAYPQTYSLEESGLRAEAVRQRKPVIINDYTQPHPRKRGYPEGHIEIRRFLSIPVFEEGRIVAVISVANKPQDYTETDAQQLTLMFDAAWKMVVRQRLTEDLQRSEERYRTLFENMAEGFALHEMIWDEAGRPVDYRFLEVNPAFERLSGLRADQVIGRTARQLLPDLEQSWIERYAEVARTGKALVFEEYAAPLKKWYEVRTFSPKAGFFAAAFTDVTQRKQWEEEREQLIQDLQRKNSELSQFTYTVSHDLKSPLITILGFLGFVEQSLEQGDLERAKADLERIRFAAEKMQALLEGLLELSRIGRLINPPSQFSFGEVVTEAVQLLLGNIYDRGRTVEFEIAHDFPNVYGDRARLLQVVQNLLDNALKYLGEQPQPRIQIGWREVADEYQFYVRDNGIGIEPAHQERVFGLFEKLDPRAQGYGVGLALVKRIIEVHHGRVWVESEGEGKGATFWFTLPKARQT